ncbi:hypothetical protein K492DRAFT_207959 [Lichtheimia hyalospora FSU 10163]|nr:hypothetical protein K492DRAFT_207959 [Lichtheimia hyalospora FSU 10163]
MSSSSSTQHPPNATTQPAYYSDDPSSLCIPLDESYASSTMLQEMLLQQMQLVSTQETRDSTVSDPGMPVPAVAKEEMSPQTKQSLRRRIRNAAPERRAVHNATERARRESLNGKFQLLATMLPNLQNFRKPSKSQIIEKALEWVDHTVYNEERYAWQMQQLEQENNWLREHLHKLGVEYQQYNGHCPTLTSLPSPPPSITSATSTATNSNNNNTLIPPSLSSPSEYGKASTMESRNNGHLVTPHSSLSQ